MWWFSGQATSWQCVSRMETQNVSKSLHFHERIHCFAPEKVSVNSGGTTMHKDPEEWKSKMVDHQVHFLWLLTWVFETKSTQSRRPRLWWQRVMRRDHGTHLKTDLTESRFYGSADPGSASVKPSQSFIHAERSTWGSTRKNRAFFVCFSKFRNNRTWMLILCFTCVYSPAQQLESEEEIPWKLDTKYHFTGVNFTGVNFTGGLFQNIWVRLCDRSCSHSPHSGLDVLRAFVSVSWVQLMDGIPGRRKQKLDIKRTHRCLTERGVEAPGLQLSLIANAIITLLLTAFW